MQILNQISLARGARTRILVGRYRQYDMAFAARMSIFLQNKSKGVATITKSHKNDAIRSPKADPDGATHTRSKELPESSSAADGTKDHDEYYSLKMHREGPNTESGELDSKSNMKEVKNHNKAMDNRYDKR